MALETTSEVTLFCGVFRFYGNGINLNMNPLILQLTGLWHGPYKINKCLKVLYGIWTLWMLSMLFGLMAIGLPAAYVYRDDLISIASNTCLSIQDIGAFIKAVTFVYRRSDTERILVQLNELSLDPVVVRGGVTSRRIIAESARKAMIVTTVFLSMGFSTYVAWMVSPAILGTGLDCWAALRSSKSSPVESESVTVNDVLNNEVVGHSVEGMEQINKTLMESVASILSKSEPVSKCSPPTLPAEGWFAFDFYQNPGYAYAYVFQIFVVYYMYIITSVIDTFFVSIMIYLSANLRVLAEDIENLRSRYKYSRKRKVNNSIMLNNFDNLEQNEIQMEHDLVDVINFHQKIIDCVKNMQSIMSAPVLVQFVISMTVMCMALYATVASSGSNHAATIKFGAYLATLFSELLLYCWFGEEVTQCNEEVVLAAYGSSWFDGSQEFKKRVLLIIVRAQKTLAFRGGAFYDLSRNTFLYIVNGSYSFFNLLMQMQN